MKRILITIFAASLLASMSCSKKDFDPGEGVPVMVSIPPQAFVVQSIGNRLVNRSILLGEGYNPHIYEPTPGDIARISTSRIYFTIGMPFEKQILGKISNGKKALCIADMSSGIHRIPIGPEDTATKTRSGKDERDPHVWLAPENLIIMAKNTCIELVKIDPDNSSVYELNLKAFDIEMRSLHRQMTASLAHLKGKSFYTYHPSFGYFAHAYGLKQVAIESEGKSPSAQEIESITAKAREDGNIMIIVEPQFDTKAAEVVANAANSRIVTIDPLAYNVYSTLTTLGTHMVALYPQQPVRQP